MKVKFTNPARFTKDTNGQTILNPFFDPAGDGPAVMSGKLIRANISAGTVVVEYSISFIRYQLELDPATDYNFKFVQNAESDLKFELILNRKVDELDALEKKFEKS